MIPIKKESAELYKEFGVYENCKFCLKPTDTWHEQTNTPICKVCAKSHKVVDVLNPILVMCIDCKWEGEKKDCDTDTEPDAFKGTDRLYYICPKCGGGIE